MGAFRLTALFHEVYIVCDVGTPFAQDELATRSDGPHRPALHDAYLRHVRETGAPFVVVSGSHAHRLEQAASAVDAMLSERPRLAA